MTSAPAGYRDHERARLLSLLRAFAYEDREVTLASGQKSRFYVDCKQVMLRGEGHYLLGRLFFDVMQRVEHEQGAVFGACGGMSVGADPLSSGLSLTAFLAGRELPAIYVRKEAKGHGTGAYLEGTKAAAEGARVVLVEDVVTTGGSSIKAAERLRDHGYVVEHLLAIVDRKAGGPAALGEKGIHLHALYTRDDFPGAG